MLWFTSNIDNINALRTIQMIAAIFLLIMLSTLRGSSAQSPPKVLKLSSLVDFNTPENLRGVQENTSGKPSLASLLNFNSPPNTTENEEISHEFSPANNTRSKTFESPVDRFRNDLTSFFSTKEVKKTKDPFAQAERRHRSSEKELAERFGCQ
mmetsp:Transcript_36066/g.45904  ORF Transcript_36066/g.45904 Transcript_36066/m.45904 type:complete len:153 (+) Transcript_36066:23-481(+)